MFLQSLLIGPSGLLVLFHDRWCSVPQHVFPVVRLISLFFYTLIFQSTLEFGIHIILSPFVHLFFWTDSLCLNWMKSPPFQFSYVLCKVSGAAIHPSGNWMKWNQFGMFTKCRNTEYWLFSVWVDVNQLEYMVRFWVMTDDGRTCWWKWSWAEARMYCASIVLRKMISTRSSRFSGKINPVLGPE